jgi:hypothetical protein
MITYKSKIITYLSWALIAYLLLQKYTEYKNKPKYIEQEEMPKVRSDDGRTKYTIKIDEDKKYNDFSIVEKFAYKIIKNDLPHSVRKEIESTNSQK